MLSCDSSCFSGVFIILPDKAVFFGGGGGGGFCFVFFNQKVLIFLVHLSH